MSKKIYIRRNVKIGFEFGCATIVTFMIGYWFHKYEIEDRDIGVVDLVSNEELSTISFPIASICFNAPIIEEKLMKIDPNFSINSYNKYLRGSFYNRSLETIDYRSISLDLANHFLYAQQLGRDQPSFKNSTAIVEHKEVFSGFYYKDTFLKCFSVGFKKGIGRNIKRIRFLYDWPRLYHDLQPDKNAGYKAVKVYVKIHYPGQFFIGDDPVKFEAYMKSKYYFVSIKEMEILERRNSRKKKCLNDVCAYDSMVVDEYVAKKGCRAPYLRTNVTVPPCNSNKTMKDGLFSYMKATSATIPKPCYRVSILKTKGEFKNNLGFEKSKVWYLTIQYPPEVKLITQSKEVDIHTLIGNIGGYLGLFLGIYSNR